MQPEKFSITSRIRSFKYAFAGLGQFVLREHNARIHLVATIAVIILSYACHLTRTEAAIITIVTGMVWVAELLNTSIEHLANLVTREPHPAIKIIKDLAAGAVLIAAITAVIVALFIFIPKFI
jgi:diacylglycerol kinase